MNPLQGHNVYMYDKKPPSPSPTPLFFFPLLTSLLDLFKVPLIASHYGNVLVYHSFSMHVGGKSCNRKTLLPL